MSSTVKRERMPERLSKSSCRRGRIAACAVLRSPLLLPYYGRLLPNSDSLPTAGSCPTTPAKFANSAGADAGIAQSDPAGDSAPIRPLEEELSEPTDRGQASRSTTSSRRNSSGLAKLDDEWRDYMSQSQSYSGRSAEDEERRQFFFDSHRREETLQQHLLEQVQSSDLSAGDRTARGVDHRQYRRRRLSPDFTRKRSRNNTGMDVGRPSRACSSSCRPFIPSASVPAICASACSFSSGASARSRVWNIASSSGTSTTSASVVSPRSPAASAPPPSRCSAPPISSPRSTRSPARFSPPDPNNYVLPDVTVEKVGGDWRDLPQRRANPASAHQQHLQGSDVAG